MEQTFAFLILKVLFDICQSLHVHGEKSYFSKTTAPFGSREDSLFSSPLQPDFNTSVIFISQNIK